MESIWTSGQNAFSAVGLNTPVARFGAVFMVAAIGEYILKPSYAYDSKGPRAPFFLDPQGTYVPALAIPIGLGVVFSVLL